MVAQIGRFGSLPHYLGRKLHVAELVRKKCQNHSVYEFAQGAFWPENPRGWHHSQWGAKDIQSDA
jgi:hypothetical protein